MKKDNKLDLIDPSLKKMQEGVHTSGVVTNQKEVILTEEELHYLNIRRKTELSTIQGLDKTDIVTRKECWYIMDSKWLNKWTEFVKGDTNEEPGPVTTIELLDPSTKKILSGLKPNIDYRGVTPMIYYIFVELYGKALIADAPELTRYICDINAIPVESKDLLQIQYSWQTKARARANTMRGEWTPPPPKDEEEDPHRPLCCGITPAHVEAFIYWFVFNIIGAAVNWCCCPKSVKEGKYGRKSSGRKGVKYSNYVPLKNNVQEDMERGESENQEGYSAGGSSESSEVEMISLADASYRPSIWSYFRRPGTGPSMSDVHNSSSSA